MLTNKGSLAAGAGLLSIMTGVWKCFEHVQNMEVRLDKIENNHLKHIEEDIKTIKTDAIIHNANVIARIDRLYDLQISRQTKN